MSETVSNERLDHTVAVLASVVRNISLKRVLHEVDPAPPLNFWRLIYGNALDMAVIDWCKLFGSDNEAQQPVHWKNVLPQVDHDDFRGALLAATGQSADEWQAYRDTVKTYRDKHAAHFDEEFIRRENDPHYPTLERAFAAACLYYDRIWALMDGRGTAGHYPRDIQDYCRRFAEQALIAASAALGATAGMKEWVR